MIARLEAIPQRAALHHQETGRPLVTLTYAQSIDGSIAARPGTQLHISGPETKLFTHQLRSVHDAILVGIGTVLADDPKLTARRVEGRNPQPVILDTHARFPLSAKLMNHPNRQPWIVTGDAAARAEALEQAGARALRCSVDHNGLIDLPAMLIQLGKLGIHSLMVEGGAHIITSFLKSKLVDQIILTIAPILVGGLRGVGDLGLDDAFAFPRITDMTFEQIGGDLVVWGDLTW